MDLFYFFAGVGGGFGAVIGYFIGKRFSNKTARTIAIIVPAVLFGQIANILSENQNVRDLISPPSRIDKISRTTAKILADNQLFKSSVSRMTREQRRSYTQQLSGKGIKRLSFSELKTWNELRAKMAKNSASLCSGFWTSGIQAQELFANLEKLSDQEIQTFLTISMTAAVSELEQKPFTPPPDSALSDGMNAIAAKLSPKEIDRMDETCKMGIRADKSDACWIMLKLMEGVELLPQQQQEEFLKSLASQ
jgi:hypothetical protein